MRALLQSGADPNAAGEAGQLPLLMAASYGDESIVRQLLQAGADPRRGAQGWSNAIDAALTGSFDVDAMTFGTCQTATVRALLEYVWALLEYSPSLTASGGVGRLGRFLVYARGCDEIEALMAAPPAAVRPTL